MMWAMTTEEVTSAVPTGHDWKVAGDAWGHSANDWSCLYEHYSLDVVIAICGRLGVGIGTSLVDIACGSGLALRLVGAMGASVAGIDASDALLAIARSRSPHADLRLGSMFELPWADASFDAAMSVNGVWGGCQAALDEASRVLRTDGRIGISFWGNGRPLDLRDCFKVFARHAPDEHFGSMKRLNDISVPGVAEEMLEASGFSVVERGSRTSVIEWPDADLAWRALSSTGPAVPALRHAGAEKVRRAVLTAIEPCRDDRGIYRFRNDHQFVIATKVSG